MKKALIFALSLMMLVVFAVGCSSKDDAKDAATEAPAVEATTEANEEPAADDAASTEEAKDDAVAIETPANTESPAFSCFGCIPENLKVTAPPVPGRAAPPFD